jgi:hypothetical protein
MSEKETKDVHVRGIPKHVHEELKRAAEESFRPVNSQILYVLSEWAESRRQSR